MTENRSSYIKSFMTEEQLIIVKLKEDIEAYRRALKAESTEKIALQDRVTQVIGAGKRAAEQADAIINGYDASLRSLQSFAVKILKDATGFKSFLNGQNLDDIEMEIMRWHGVRLGAGPQEKPR